MKLVGGGGSLTTVKRKLRFGEMVKSDGREEKRKGGRGRFSWPGSDIS